MGWIESVNNGYKGGLSPFNFAVEARRAVFPISLGALSGGETFRIYASKQIMVLEDVIITSDTATSGSTSSNNWSFSVTAGGSSVATKNTSSAEIAVDTQYALGVATDTRLADGNVVKLTVTKNGTPTSLAGAQIEVHVSVLLLE